MVLYADLGVQQPVRRPQARGVAVAYGKVYVGKWTAMSCAGRQDRRGDLENPPRRHLAPALSLVHASPARRRSITAWSQWEMAAPNGDPSLSSRWMRKTGKLVWRFNDTAGPMTPISRAPGKRFLEDRRRLDVDAVAVDTKPTCDVRHRQSQSDLYGDFRRATILHHLHGRGACQDRNSAWYYQQIPHDVWDLDSAAPTVLFDVLDKTARR